VARDRKLLAKAKIDVFGGKGDADWYHLVFLLRQCVNIDKNFRRKLSHSDFEVGGVSSIRFYHVGFHLRNSKLPVLSTPSPGDSEMTSGL
jgi:hypothetical protein